MAIDTGVETSYSAMPVDYQPIRITREDLAKLSPEERAARKAVALRIAPELLPQIEAEVERAKLKWGPEETAQLPKRVTCRFIASQMLTVLKDQNGVYAEVVHSTSKDPHCIRRAGSVTVLGNWSFHPKAEARLACYPQLRGELERFCEKLNDERFDPTNDFVKNCRQLSVGVIRCLDPRLQIPAELL